jgi:hypothetical protein
MDDNKKWECDKCSPKLYPGNPCIVEIKNGIEYFEANPVLCPFDLGEPNWKETKEDGD